MTVRLGPGPFVAVVGASGVGKDALMAYARERSDAFFPRRVVTRPAGPGENHLPVDEITFESARARGDFAVHWSAHGLRYGVPVEVDDVVESGRAVVANVSRSVLDDLAVRYERLVVVRITVSDAVRRARLRSRGRESAGEVAGRLTRADPAPHRLADVVIHNDGSVADGGEQLLAALRTAGRLDDRPGAAVANVGGLLATRERRA